MKNLFCLLMLAACVALLFSSEKPIETLIKEAEQGDAEAQAILGVMYANGEGVSQDYAEAVKWTNMAAEQGDSGAQHNLGMAYEHGLGVSQDYTEAVKWYRKAAEQGAADAQFNLAMAYENGLGVPQENIFAYMWFDISASNGYEIDVNGFSAQVLLGIQMPSDDIKEAKIRAKICLESNYKQCD